MSNGHGLALQFDHRPLTPTVINGAEVLDAVVRFIGKYVWLSLEQLIALALWVLHTHAFAAARSTPYIRVESPEPECGKTTLVELLEQLVARPWLTMGLTRAVLVRKVDTEKSTVLFDEVDKQLAGDKEMVAAITGVLNSGYKRSGAYTLMVPNKKEGWVPREFKTFSPKLFSGLGNLPDTLKSRSIPIRMDRMPRTLRLAEVDEYVTDDETAALRSRMEEWATSELEKLRAARPEVAGLGHREREVVRPLLAIADTAGGDWPELARKAMVVLMGEKARDPSIGEQLLADIREIAQETEADVLLSADLAERLRSKESSPWAEWRKGKGLSPHGLAGLLRKYRIYPDQAWDGKKVRGYRLEDFRGAFERYLSPLVVHSPDSGRYVGRTRMDIDGDLLFGSVGEEHSYHSEKCLNPNKDAVPTDLPIETPGMNKEGQKPPSWPKAEKLCAIHGFHMGWFYEGDARLCVRCHPGGAT